MYFTRQTFGAETALGGAARRLPPTFASEGRCQRARLLLMNVDIAAWLQVLLWIDAAQPHFPDCLGGLEYEPPLCGTPARHEQSSRLHSTLPQSLLPAALHWLSAHLRVVCFGSRCALGSELAFSIFLKQRFKHFKNCSKSDRRAAQTNQSIKKKKKGNHCSI